jgi:hypothetical protein
LVFLETPPVANKRQWPELVGRTGKDAVQIIKKESGRIVMMYRKISFSELN